MHGLPLLEVTWLRAAHRVRDVQLVGSTQAVVAERRHAGKADQLSAIERIAAAVCGGEGDAHRIGAGGAGDRDGVAVRCDPEAPASERAGAQFWNADCDDLCACFSAQANGSADYPDLLRNTTGRSLSNRNATAARGAARGRDCG